MGWRIRKVEKEDEAKELAQKRKDSVREKMNRRQSENK
jgi:hypothetical protein